MSGSLKRSQPFRRGSRRRLPGQSSDDELGLGLTIRYVDRPSSTVINRELVRIGHIEAGRFVEIDSDGLRLWADGQVHVEISANGDLFIGEDTSDPNKTILSIFAKDQTYNSEAVSAGDVLFGDNSGGNANLYWDKSSGQLQFRGGQVSELHIDTDGSLTAGGGDVHINSDGLSLNPGDGDTEKIKVVDGGTNIVEIYGKTDPGVHSELLMVGRGRGDEDVDTPEGAVSLAAITHDGTTHAGAASVSIELTTASDRVAITAGETRILGDLEVAGTAVFNELGLNEDFRIEGDSKTHLFFVDAHSDNIGIDTDNPNDSCIMDFYASNLAVRLPILTTTERDSLSAQNGMIIYNSTVGKFQGRASSGGTAWKDLH